MPGPGNIYNRIFTYALGALAEAEADFTDTVGVTDQLHSNRTSAADTVGITDSFHSSQERVAFADTVGITDALNATVHGHPYFDAVKADSPELYWILNDPNGPTAVDSSGNGNNGTYEGAPTPPTYGVPGLTQDAGETAVYFPLETSDSGSYGESNGTFGPNYSTFSFETLVYCPSGPNSGINGYYLIFPNFGAGIYLFGDGTTITPSMGWYTTGSIFNSTTGAGTFSYDAVHHVVGTYDGTTASIYIDGTLANSTTISGGIVGFSPSTFDIGCLDYDANPDITLDEVAFYSRALTSIEVAAHYADVTGGGYPAAVVSSTPLLYYRLDDTSGTVMADSSGNSNDGTYFFNPTLGVAGLLSGDPDTAVTFFSPSDAFVESVPWTTTNYTQFTMEAIIQLDLIADGRYHTAFGFSSLTDSALFAELDIHLQSGVLHFLAEIDDDSTSFFPFIDYVATGIANDGATPFHVAVVYDGTSLILYIDGDNVAQDSTYPGGSINVTSTYIYSAADDLFEGDYAVGVYNHIAFYDHALTPDRITAHWNASGIGPAIGPRASFGDIVGITETLSVATFLIRPILTSIAPTIGEPETHTVVTLTGTHLGSTIAVYFGSTAATSYIINSPTSITATSPLLEPGSYTVQVADVHGLVTNSAGVGLFVIPTEVVVAGADVVSGVPSLNSRSKPARIVPVSSINTTAVSVVPHGVQPTSNYSPPRFQDVSIASPKVSIDNLNVHPLKTADTSTVSQGSRTIIAHPTEVYENSSNGVVIPFHDSMWGVLYNAGITLQELDQFTTPLTLSLYEVVPAPTLPTGWSIHLYEDTEITVQPYATLPATGEGITVIGGSVLGLALSDTVMVWVQTVSGLNEFIDHQVVQLQLLVRTGDTMAFGPAVSLPVALLTEPGYSAGSEICFSRVSDTEFVVSYGIYNNVFVSAAAAANVVLGCSISGDAITIESQSFLTIGNPPPTFASALEVNGNPIPGGGSFPTELGYIRYDFISHWDGAGHIITSTGESFGFGDSADFGGLLAFDFSISGGVTALVAAHISPLDFGYSFVGAIGEGAFQMLSTIQTSPSEIWAAVYFDGSTFIDTYPVTVSAIDSTSPIFASGFFTTVEDGFPGPYLNVGMVQSGDFFSGFSDTVSYSWVTQSGGSVSIGPVKVAIDPALIVGGGAQTLSFAEGAAGFAAARHANNIVIFGINGGFVLPDGDPYPWPGGGASEGTILIIPVQVDAP